MTVSLTDRLCNIKLLLMDCDGVLTDGRLYFGPTGEELKVFDVRDGQGIVTWHKAGNRSGIISGRSSPIVELRGKELGISIVRQGISSKVDELDKILVAECLAASEVAFIGDDIGDLEIMFRVGLAVAVSDAHITLHDRAHYVTKHPGGRGAVRELIDLLLDNKA